MSRRTGHLPRSVRRPLLPVLLAAVVGMAATTAACGGGSLAQPTTTVAAATARAEVARAYGTLFDLADKAVAPKLAVIEDGASLRQAITQALASPLAASASGARVDAVELLTASACRAAAITPPCAKVTYDILAPSGQPLLSGSVGYAVDVAGRWVVAKATICGLLELLQSQGSAAASTPAGC